ncbi:MAG: OmpA family protein [Sulfuricurvum sp.]
MDHTNKETLSAFIDNKLLGKIKIDVMNHLRQCEECRLLMAETSLFIKELKESQDESNMVPTKSTSKNIYKMFYKYITPLALAASVVLVLLPIIHIQDSNAPQMTSVKDINSYNEGAETYTDAPSAQEVSTKPLVVAHTKTAPIAAAASAKSNTPSTVPEPVKSFALPAPLAIQSRANVMLSFSPMPKSVSSVPPQVISDDFMDSDSAKLAVERPVPTPLMAAFIAPKTTAEPIVLDPIYFEANKLSITDTMQKQIRKNIAKLKNNNMMSYAIRLEGHSHNAGGEEYNYPLSIQMAENVKNALIVEGIAIDQISTIGFSNTQPICKETTPECKAKNNRVEFIVHIY